MDEPTVQPTAETKITREMIERGERRIRRIFAHSDRLIVDASARDILLIVRSVLSARHEVDDERLYGEWSDGRTGQQVFDPRK